MMLTGSPVSYLSHILKSLPKDSISDEWMKTANDAHLLTWLNRVGFSTLDLFLTASYVNHMVTLLEPLVMRGRSPVPHPHNGRRTLWFMGLSHCGTQIFFQVQGDAGVLLSGRCHRLHCR